MVSKSSRRWLKEHFSDTYVKEAQKSGYRSRSVYKLIEIDQRDHLFKPGMVVIDLGAAPGGWSQVAIQRVKPQGRVIALDLLNMDPIDGVEFIQGDFSNEPTIETLLTQLNDSKADWLLSDMAPNRSGNASIDVPRAMYLAELTLEFALQILKNQGGLLIKVLQGEGFEALMAEIKRNFKNVFIRKPKASRGRSREIYILARELKGE